MKILRGFLVVILLASFWPNNAAAASPKVAIFHQINTVRRVHNRPALVLSTRLSQVALRRAKLMAEKGVFSHTIPGQPSTWAMVRETGYTFTAGGEVIGLNYSDPRRLVRAWQLSTPHRSILYSMKYNQVGIGYIVVKNNKKISRITVAIFAFHPKNTP